MSRANTTVALVPAGPEARRSALVAPGRVVRRLEGTEHLTAIGNEFHGGNFNVVAAIELSGPVTLAVLTRALEEVQRHHECLQVEVVADPVARGQYVFQRTDEKPRLEVSSVPWRAVWDQLLGETIEGLAWRAVWTKSHLLVHFHHAVTDALSLAVFFDRVLESMFRAAQGISEIGPSRPICPPVHELVRSRWPLRAVARISAQRLFGNLQFGPVNPAPQRRWYCAMRTLERDAVSAMIERCRSNGVTLTNAFSAAATLELAARVKSEQPFGVALVTSVDLRRMVPGIDTRQMGLLASGVHSFFSIRGGENLWKMAGEARRQLERAISRQEHRDMPHFHRMFGSRLASWLASKDEGRAGDCALLVSNAGRVEGLEHGPFRAETLFMTGSQAAFGNTFFLVAATVHGRMCLHLGFPTPTISVDEGEATVDRILARLS